MKFASFTYNVSEGSSTSVTVRTIGAHDFAFTVFLIIEDGECQSVMDSITVYSMLLSCCASCCSKESTLTLASFDIHLSRRRWRFWRYQHHSELPSWGGYFPHSSCFRQEWLHCWAPGELHSFYWGPTWCSSPWCCPIGRCHNFCWRYRLWVQFQYTILHQAHSRPTLPISIDLSVNTWSACNTGVYCT